MYSLGAWFVSGICVWIPCIKETMMMMMMMISTKSLTKAVTLYAPQIVIIE
jgi:hypothetical protein